MAKSPAERKAAQRGMTAKTLRDGGYNEMANQYDIFDRQSIAIDAVLGVAFGGVGRFLNARGESVATPEFSPAEVDAALAANASHHAEIDVAPGVPVNVLSRDAHIQALQKAMNDVSQGRAVDVASIAEPASFSDIPGRRNLISQAIDETLYRTEEGSTQFAVDTRALEQQATQALDVEQVNQLQADITGIERSIETLNQERTGVLNEQPSGSGKELSRGRSARQERLQKIIWRRMWRVASTSRRGQSLHDVSRQKAILTHRPCHSIKQQKCALLMKQHLLNQAHTALNVNYLQGNKATN